MVPTTSRAPCCSPTDAGHESPGRLDGPTVLSRSVSPRAERQRQLQIIGPGAASGLGSQLVWLYPPMTEQDYPERTGCVGARSTSEVTTMSQHEHEERRADNGRPVRRSGDATAQHPLLEPRQQAGNAAVAQLMAAQRHTLDPEEHG